MEITVFSAAGCGGCIATKTHLRQRGLPFTEVRVDQNEAVLDSFHRAGYSGVPVVMVKRRDDDEVPDIWNEYRSTLIDKIAKDEEIE
jgi:glutaredoxin